MGSNSFSFLLIRANPTLTGNNIIIQQIRGMSIPKPFLYRFDMDAHVKKKGYLSSVHNRHFAMYLGCQDSNPEFAEHWVTALFLAVKDDLLRICRTIKPLIIRLNRAEYRLICQLVLRQVGLVTGDSPRYFARYTLFF